MGQIEQTLVNRCKDFMISSDTYSNTKSMNLKSEPITSYLSDVAFSHLKPQSIVEATNCPGQHGLIKSKTPQSGYRYRCDIGKDRFRAGTVMYGCKDCQYYACRKCNVIPPTAVKCNNCNQHV